MRKQTNKCPPSVSGRVRKLCVDKLVLDLALAAFSHILFVINCIDTEMPEIQCLREVQFSLGGRNFMTHCDVLQE